MCITIAIAIDGGNHLNAVMIIANAAVANDVLIVVLANAIGIEDILSASGRLIPGASDADSLVVSSGAKTIGSLAEGKP